MKILQRLFGVFTLKSFVYKEIIENASLWKEPALFVTLGAFVSSLSFTWLNGFTPQSIVRLTTPFISWILFGYLCAFFMKIIYKLNVPAGRVMKIYGYVQLFSLVGLLLITWKAMPPLIHLLVILIGYALVFLFYIANVIGVREASQTSTGKAIVVFLLSFFVILVFTTFYGGIIAALV